jgi:hypothetical protein
MNTVAVATLQRQITSQRRRVRQNVDELERLGSLVEEGQISRNAELAVVQEEFELAQWKLARLEASMRELLK